MQTLRLLLTTVLLLAVSAVAQTTNPVVTYAYVGTNANKIYGYAIHQNGANYSLAGSPFSGASSGIANTYNFLFGHNDTNIVTYQRSSSGALHAVATVNGIAHNDTPTGSGVGALTLDRTGADLYAGEVNFQGTDNGGYAEFAKMSNGSLQWRSNAGINTDYGGFLTFSHDNKFAYGTGCYFINWDIFGLYRSSTTGALTPFSTGNTMPPDPTGDFMCPNATASSARGYLAVAYDLINPATPATTRIAIYQITSSGALKYLNSYTTTFNGINALYFDPTGNYLAAAGNGIGVYRLNSNATLSKVSGRLDTSVRFNSVRWDNTWHVLASSYTNFYVFNGRYGVLSQAGNPHPVSMSTNVAVVPLQ